MNSAYLMTGSTCYLHPADDFDGSYDVTSARVVQAELDRIEQRLNNGQFDSVPGIDSLRSELHRVEQLQKTTHREQVAAD